MRISKTNEELNVFYGDTKVDVLCSYTLSQDGAYVYVEDLEIHDIVFINEYFIIDDDEINWIKSNIDNLVIEAITTQYNESVEHPDNPFDDVGD